MCVSLISDRRASLKLVCIRFLLKSHEGHWTRTVHVILNCSLLTVLQSMNRSTISLKRTTNFKELIRLDYFVLDRDLIIFEARCFSQGFRTRSKSSFMYVSCQVLFKVTVFLSWIKLGMFRINIGRTSVEKWRILQQMRTEDLLNVL